MLAVVMLTLLVLWMGVFFVFFRSARRDSKRDDAERRAHVLSSAVDSLKKSSE